MSMVRMHRSEQRRPCSSHPPANAKNTNFQPPAIAFASLPAACWRPDRGADSMRCISAASSQCCTSSAPSFRKACRIFEERLSAEKGEIPGGAVSRLPNNAIAVDVSSNLATWPMERGLHGEHSPHHAQRPVRMQGFPPFPATERSRHGPARTDVDARAQATLWGLTLSARVTMPTSNAMLLFTQSS